MNQFPMKLMEEPMKKKQYRNTNKTCRNSQMISYKHPYGYDRQDFIKKSI